MGGNYRVCSECVDFNTCKYVYDSSQCELLFAELNATNELLTYDEMATLLFSAITKHNNDIFVDALLDVLGKRIGSATAEYVAFKISQSKKIKEWGSMYQRKIEERK